MAKCLKVSIGTSRHLDVRLFALTRSDDVQSFTLHFWEDDHSWLVIIPNPGLTEKIPLHPFRLVPSLVPFLNTSISMSLMEIFPNINEQDANEQTLYLRSREQHPRGLESTRGHRLARPKVPGSLYFLFTRCNLVHSYSSVRSS